MLDFIFLIVIVVFPLRSLQHFSSPIDDCTLAILCNHTWVKECGNDVKDSTKRIFLDQCDMHEYNCDHKKEFARVDISECPSSTSTQSQATTPQTTTPTTTECPTKATVSPPPTTNPCAFPEGCEGPKTWETTAQGETRDFFQILKEKYGRRARFLRASTHWPTRMPMITFDRSTYTFMFGRHNDAGYGWD